MLTYDTIESLCRAAEESRAAHLRRWCWLTRPGRWSAAPGVLYARMLDSLKVMQNAVQAGHGPRSALGVGGLSGGDAAKMQAYAATGGADRRHSSSACHSPGPGRVRVQRLPWARSSPPPPPGPAALSRGTLLSVLDEGRCTERQAVMALFTAGAIGMVIANRAFIAGAQGGCQAECGSAAAMAAAALVEVSGGSPPPVRRCLRHGPEKPAGSGLRPGGRTGGGALRQAQRGRHRRSLHGGGDGPGGHPQPHPRGRVSSTPCGRWVRHSPALCGRPPRADLPPPPPARP